MYYLLVKGVFCSSNLSNFFVFSSLPGPKKARFERFYQCNFPRLDIYACFILRQVKITTQKSCFQNLVFVFKIITINCCLTKCVLITLPKQNLSLQHFDSYSLCWSFIVLVDLHVSVIIKRPLYQTKLKILLFVS